LRPRQDVRFPSRTTNRCIDPFGFSASRVGLAFHPSNAYVSRSENHDEAVATSAAVVRLFVQHGDKPYYHLEQLRQSFTDWMQEEAAKLGLDAVTLKTYELANPLGMSADGLLRYWKKTRNAKESNP
jgi:hypothetical protein